MVLQETKDPLARGDLMELTDHWVQWDQWVPLEIMDPLDQQDQQDQVVLQDSRAHQDRQEVLGHLVIRELRDSKG